MIDILITGGDVYDGLGGGPERADVAIVGDRVAEVRPGLGSSDGVPQARVVIDATGRAVSPGFINILSHSNVSILRDPRSLGELTQGVTTEISGRAARWGRSPRR